MSKPKIIWIPFEKKKKAKTIMHDKIMPILNETK